MGNRQAPDALSAATVDASRIIGATICEESVLYMPTMTTTEIILVQDTPASGHCSLI